MEARLLCLEKGELMPTSPPTWLITNGTGVAISEAHIQPGPTTLVTINKDSRSLIEYLTTAMAQATFRVAEPGWSKWKLHSIGEITHAAYSNGEWNPPMASAIIVRNRVTGSEQALQGQGQGRPTSSGEGR